METKIAVTLKRPLVTLLSLSALSLPMAFSPAYADEFLCEATQASPQQLPQLDPSCPIGEGLWGRQKPKGQASQFWIQCGIYPEPLSLKRAKRLYQRISTDVWMKPEQKEYRCLIGPYTQFSQAQRELAQVRKERGYQDAFIREIKKSSSALATVSTNPPKPSPPVVAEKTSTQHQTVFPAPVKPRVAAPMPKVSAEQKTEISIRVQATVNGKQYQVPYVMLSDDVFYMEHELPWNRLSYDGANNTCRQLGMHLAKPSEWQALLDSQQMTKGKWPIHLPYWGAEKNGLFYSGKVKQLKGSSKLNVLCVK